jgi:hypothetical protein
MLGHTVRILADYDGLKGHYGWVLSSGLGKVEVDVHIYGELEPRRICFLEREVAVVPMNDTLRDTGEEMAVDAEVYRLIERSVRLKVGAMEASATLGEAMRLRSRRLQQTIRCLQRVRAVTQAHQLARVIGDPCCSALVVVGEGRVGV